MGSAVDGQAHDAAFLRVGPLVLGFDVRVTEWTSPGDSVLPPRPCEESQGAAVSHTRRCAPWSPTLKRCAPMQAAAGGTQGARQ